jgi:hypothetical protein
MITPGHSMTPRPIAAESRRTAAIKFCMLALLLALFLIAPATKVQGQDTVVLPAGAAGTVYTTFDLNTLVNGGVAPLSWPLVSGALPNGMTLDSGGAQAGKLRGTPTTAGTSTFTIQVTDAASNKFNQIFSITIKPFGINSDVADIVKPPAQPPARTPAPPFVLASSTADEETIGLTEEMDFDYTNVFNPDLSIRDGMGQTLIDGTLGKATTPQSDVPHDGDYCVIHIIQWKPLKEGNSDPKHEFWALFKARADAGGLNWEPQYDPEIGPKDPNFHKLYNTRIYGHKRVAVLLIHLKTPASWDIKYKVTVNRKTPTPIANVLTLAKSVIPGFTAGTGERTEPPTKDIWGARMMLVRYESSELIVQVNTVTSGDNGEPVKQAKDYSKQFVNEGRYHWDVSVGVPINSFRELQFNSDGNKVTTSSKEKQSVYGFLNLYPWAVDLKGKDFLTKPHILIGVPLGTKPLHHPFVGVGTGIFKAPIKFNLFAGVVFNRERVPRTLETGDAATPSQLESDLHTRYVRKFMFGINFPISQITDAIKKQ